MIRKTLVILIIVLIVCCPFEVDADMFGGDVAVLLQILVQAVETVTELKNVISNGADTLNLMRDLNSGIRSGLDVIRIVNPHFNPGSYGDLRDSDSVLRAIHDVYGTVPQGSADHDLIESQDETVAEVISMNRNIYDYADQADRERDRILFHNDQVSPQGAAKLQNQALAVLIGIGTQLLRAQSQMLKVMGQNMAYSNRREKLESTQFENNYNEISKDVQSLPTDLNLPSIQGGSK